MDNEEQYWEDQIKIGKSLLGKKVSEIPTVLIEANEKKQSERMSTLATKVRTHMKQHQKRDITDDAPVRWGSVSIGGFIRGSITAKILFDQNMTFEGSCWCGPQIITGGGCGAWFLTPKDGQEMDFAFGAASYVGGEVQVYWSINGEVVGQLCALVGGAAISGGAGKGKWKRAD